MLIVYSQPNCPHCDLAKAYLDELAVPYSSVNIREDAEALDFIRAENHKTTPQIYVGTKLLVEGGNKGIRALSRDDILERISLLTA